MNTPKRILVIRLSAIGDIVLTTPVLRWLKARFPDASIEYLTKREHEPLLTNNPYIDCIHLHDSFTPKSKLHFDIVIDLQNNRRSQSLTPKAATKVYRYRKENWKKFLLVWAKLNLYKEIVPVPERYKKAVAELQLPDDGKGCDFFLTSQELQFAQSIVKLGEGQQALSVCYGAKHFTKRFPPHQYAAFLSKLNPKSWKIFLLGSRSDSESGKLIRENMLQRGFPAECVIDLSGKLSIRESATILSLSHHVLTGDTGLMHIAAAFQKKCTVIFGSSVKEFGFLPFRTPYTLIENNEINCRPCSHIGRNACPKGHFKCMNDLKIPLSLIN